MRKYTFIKHTLRTVIVTIMVIYFGLIALLNISYVQHGISSVVTRELKKLFNTEVSVGNIDLGLLNRIIIQDLTLYDKTGKELLSVARFSVKFDYKALLQGQVSIHSVQLFAANIRLNKENKSAPANFQFIIDALASKDKKKEDSSFINLRINSILIRRGSVSYDILSEKETPYKFNASHIGINNLSANISLKALTEDSVNVQVKRLSLNEKSGFTLKKLTMKLNGNKTGVRLSDFNILLPESRLAIDTLTADYKDISAIADVSQIKYSGNLKASVVLADAQSFVPVFKHFKDNLNIDLSFHSEKNRHVVDKLKVKSGADHIDIDVSASYSNLKAGVNNNDNAEKDTLAPRFNARINKINVGENGAEWLLSNLSDKPKIPEVLKNLGKTSINGSLNGTLRDIEAKLSILSAVGSVQSQVTLHSDSGFSKRTYSGHVYSPELNLGKLFNKKSTLGKTGFNIELNGLTYKNNKPESYVKGNIDFLEFKNYTYQNIELDGKYSGEGFNGQIAVDDDNLRIKVNGSILTGIQTPEFHLNAQLRDFNPGELGLTNDKKFTNTTYSLNLGADFSGNSIDDIKGKILIDSLNCDSEDDNLDYFLPKLHLIANSMNGNDKEVVLDSYFMKGIVKGEYSYRTIVSSIMKVAQRYMPSLLGEKTGKTGRNRESENNFSFKFDLLDADFLSKGLKLPVKMDMPANINGYIDDINSKVYINANIPQLTYNNKKYESTTLLFENPANDLHCNIRTSMLMKKGAMISLSLNAEAHNDTLSTTLFWGNNTSVTYGGKVSALAAFSKPGNSRNLHTDIHLDHSEIILNDTIWNIHPASICIDKDSIKIRDFLFEHANQHVKINGRLGKKDTDTCFVDLQNINLLYVMDMIQFNAVKFEGNTSGKVIASGVLDKPALDARLMVNNFSLNDAILGEAKIKGGFDNEKGRILLNADIQKSDNTFTKVDGYVSPKEKGLDLHINAGGTTFAFLEHFIKDIFSDVEGKVYGNVRLHGPFKELDLEGHVDKAEVAMNVNVLNSRFKAVTENMDIKSGEFLFENVQLSDMEGNKGTVNGYLRHNHLKHLNYRFNFDTHNMQVFRIDQESPEFPFYGHIYATGNALVRGDEHMGLAVDGQLRAEDGTSFVYVLGTAAEAISKQFITFVDKTPKRKTEEVDAEVYHYMNKTEDEEENSTPADIKINLQIEPAPRADMKIIMDPASGDYISAKGTGNLRVNFYNKGNFQIFGNYVISEGIYKLSMQNVIRKDFVLRPGGTVSFNGDPKAANLNVQAAYTVPSASLNDLIPDATSTRGNIRVNCLVNLTGLLTSPNLSFDLELPTVNEEDRELVRSLTSTPEQMTTQIIYLLGVGKFYTYDYTSQTGQSDATSSLAFSTLSGQLNNMLSQVIDSQNWNVGTNLSTGQNGWTDVEAEAILSGRLLNNRLIINGNFGYKENTLKSTNFVGDFEAIWLLTKNGDFRLRGYNQTNDRYFMKSTLTTQGIGLIYKKDFTYWRELVDWLGNLRRYRKKKLSDEEKDKADKENADKKNVDKVNVDKENADNGNTGKENTGKQQ